MTYLQSIIIITTTTIIHHELGLDTPVSKNMSL